MIRLLVTSICCLWFVAESILGRWRQARQVEDRDKSSLQLVMAATFFAAFASIFIGYTGLGRIETGSELIRLLGIILLLVGIGIRWTSIFTLNRYFTVNVAILEGHKLIRTGLYKYVRHPAYAGALLAFLGLGLAFSNWLSIIAGVVPSMAAILYRIRIEEEALKEILGSEYLEYARDTKRFIPGIY